MLTRFVQRVRGWRRGTRLLIVSGITVAAVVGIALAPRIPQPLSYHDFADKRRLLGVPDALDVLSNIPFAIFGLWGLWWLARRRARFLDVRERWPYAAFFVGLALTSLGSGYYHLDPNNQTLLWDRLPMTVAFMGLLDAVLAERVSVRAGMRWLAPLLTLGAASALYWEWTEALGRGDLRWYGLVQFGGALVIPGLLALFPARYDKVHYLGYAALAYAAAKMFEAADKPLYHVLGGAVSGHTLKHLSASLAGYYVLRMLQKRRPLALPATASDPKPARLVATR
jgi:hypothetical protein